jgi:hypothetical protein
LQTLLGIKPSPLFNVIRRSINEWQLDNASASKADCEIWLKERWQGSGRAEWEAEVVKVEVPKAEKRKR